MPYSMVDMEDLHSKSPHCMAQDKQGWSVGMTKLPLTAVLRYRLELTDTDCSDQFNSCGKRSQAYLYPSLPAKGGTTVKASIISKLGLQKTQEIQPMMIVSLPLLIWVSHSSLTKFFNTIPFFFPLPSNLSFFPFFPPLQNIAKVNVCSELIHVQADRVYSQGWKTSKDPSITPGQDDSDNLTYIPSFSFRFLSYPLILKISDLNLLIRAVCALVLTSFWKAYVYWIEYFIAFDILYTIQTKKPTHLKVGLSTEHVVCLSICLIFKPENLFLILITIF